MNGRGTWIGFLAMAFAVVGLAGLFATYAMPAPWRRAALEITALDAEGPVETRITTALGPDAARRLDAPGVAPDAALRAARAAVLQRADESATSAETSTRWLIVVVTIMGAVFGAAVLGVGHSGIARDAEPSRLKADRPPASTKA